ncbi:MAG: aminotransferase class V-fold PLP-dependent enzyme, partial [Candidatus Hadarchaeales archaeon]
EENIPHVVLHGPRGNKRSPSNVNYSFKGIEGEAILLRLDLQGIAVATGSACATRKLEPSHVLTAIGIKPEVAHGSIRFTFTWMTKMEEIDYTLEALPGVIEGLRRISPVKPEEM